jgi:hypothetical protein
MDVLEVGPEQNSSWFSASAQAVCIASYLLVANADGNQANS